MKLDQAMSSTDLLNLIRAKFCSPFYLCFSELRDATGFDAGGSADAVALGLYRSRGRDLFGFEIKVSRSDWLSELKKPEKAERIAQYCDWWYLVVPDESIVKMEELPHAWGLYVCKKGKLSLIQKPTRLEAKPLSRAMLCSLVKAAHDAVQKPANDEIKKLKDAAFLDGVQDGEWRSGNWRHHHEDLEQRIQAFERASGVRINGYEGSEKIGAAVRLVLAQQNLADTIVEELRWKVEALERLTENAKRQFEEIRAYQKARAEQQAEPVTAGR